MPFCLIWCTLFLVCLFGHREDSLIFLYESSWESVPIQNLRELSFVLDYLEKIPESIPLIASSFLRRPSQGPTFLSPFSLHYALFCIRHSFNVDHSSCCFNMAT